MSEEHQDEVVVEEVAEVAKRVMVSWLAFILALVVLSGVVTARAVTSNGENLCVVSDAKCTVSSFFSIESAEALAARELAKGFEGKAKQCDKSKECDKQKTVSSGPCMKGAHVQYWSSASIISL